MIIVPSFDRYERGGYPLTAGVWLEAIQVHSNLHACRVLVSVSVLNKAQVVAIEY